MANRPNYRPWNELRRTLPPDVETLYAASMEALRDELGREPEAFFDEEAREIIVPGTGGPGRIDIDRFDAITDEEIERAVAEEGLEIDWSSVKVMRPEKPPKPADS